MQIGDRKPTAKKMNYSEGGKNCQEDRTNLQQWLASVVVVYHIAHPPGQIGRSVVKQESTLKRDWMEPHKNKVDLY